MKAKIFYHDIGDYLSREDKLKIIAEAKTMLNLPLTELHPNEHGDWISVRNDAFDNYISLDSEKKFDLKTRTFFIIHSRGIASSADSWVYNFSKQELEKNVSLTIGHYNEQRDLITKGKQNEPERNSTKGNWTRDWLTQLKKNKVFKVEGTEFRIGTYRCFTKQQYYFADDLNQERYLMPKLFPTKDIKNLVICVAGVGGSKDFSVLITDVVPDLQVIFNGQCFPLYYYEESNATQKGLFDAEDSQQYVRRDAISDFILERAKQQYGVSASSGAFTKEDIFYYVYGFLHSKAYRETFANDLKKMLPRLPLVENVKDFWAFSKAGRQLAALHLNYESVEPFADVSVAEPVEATAETYKVEKMRFPKKGEKDSIIYNSKITLSNIPAKAYEYVVNGKSAIEWIMERYQITTHKESGIVNNPNDWATEVGNPRYILDLLLSIINVSVQTVDIVNALPKVDFGADNTAELETSE